MSRAKFKPGQWKVGNGRKTDLYMGWDTILAVRENGEKYVIARTNANYEEEAKKNAKFIASAPEMYLVIVAMLKCAKSGDMFKGAEVLALMEEVVKKARGEA